MAQEPVSIAIPYCELDDNLKRVSMMLADMDKIEAQFDHIFVPAPPPPKPIR